MGFINEKIQGDECLLRFREMQLIEPLSGKEAQPWKWTIDREAGDVLVSLGGDGSEYAEIPEFFTLSISNAQISFRGRWSGKYSHESRADGVYEVFEELIWKVESVCIPASLISKSDYVLSVIRESLAKYGVGYDDSRVKKVRVDVDGAVVGI